MRQAPQMEQLAGRLRVWKVPAALAWADIACHPMLAIPGVLFLGQVVWTGAGKYTPTP